LLHDVIFSRRQPGRTGSVKVAPGGVDISPMPGAIQREYVGAMFMVLGLLMYLGGGWMASVWLVLIPEEWVEPIGQGLAGLGALLAASAPFG
jgi:hypothetical protein